jgi:hypothetical protein
VADTKKVIELDFRTNLDAVQGQLQRMTSEVDRLGRAQTQLSQGNLTRFGGGALGQATQIAGGTPTASQPTGAQAHAFNAWGDKMVSGIDRIVARLERLIGITERESRMAAERRRAPMWANEELPGGGPGAGPGGGGGGGAGRSMARWLAFGGVSLATHALTAVSSPLANPHLSAEAAQRQAVFSLPIIGHGLQAGIQLGEFLTGNTAERRRLGLTHEQFTASDRARIAGQPAVTSAQARYEEAGGRTDALVRSGALSWRPGTIGFNPDEAAITRQVQGFLGSQARTEHLSQIRHREEQSRLPARERQRQAQLDLDAAREAQIRMYPQMERARQNYNLAFNRRQDAQQAAEQARQGQNNRPWFDPQGWNVGANLVNAQVLSQNAQRTAAEEELRRNEYVQQRTRYEQQSLELAQRESAVRRANVDLARAELDTLRQREQTAAGNAQRLGGMNRVQYQLGRQALALYNRLGPENAPAELAGLARQFAGDHVRNREEQLGAERMRRDAVELRQLAPGQFRDTDLQEIRARVDAQQVRVGVQVRLDETVLAQEIAQQLGRVLREVRAQLRLDVDRAANDTWLGQIMRWANGG